MSDEVNLTIVNARIQKATATGAMSTVEQVELFAGIDALLKEHAQKKHKELSAEQAFRKELESDESFRSVVQKSQALQAELAAA